MKSILERSWVSPFVGITFFIISITGILMLFHIKNHAMSALHEWMGVVFVIAGIIHLILNWKAFLSCFWNRRSGFAIGLVLILTFVLLFSGMSEEDNKGHETFSGKGGYPYAHRK